MTWLALVIKYRNEIAIGLIVIALVAAGFYIRYVFNDRENLQAQLVEMRKEIGAIKKQQTLNEDIVNAIQKIKVQSNNYVSVVETAPSPAPNSYSTLISAGLYTQRVYSSNTTRNSSTSP